jgi:hypothetical protein
MHTRPGATSSSNSTWPSQRTRGSPKPDSIDGLLAALCMARA